MIDISLDTIAAAKNNDIAAVTEVVRVMDERVTQLARKYATSGGRTDTDLLEDLAQEGRVAVWASLSRFQGSSVAELFTFVDRTVSGKLSEERKAQTRQGVSVSVAKDFETALTLSGGDAYDAQRVVQLSEYMGDRRMSADMAYAARLSWQGIDSLDVTLSEPDFGDGIATKTVADTLHSTYGIPDEMLEAQDINAGQRNETRKAVRATLDKLGKKQADVLRGTYGISPAPMAFGTDNEDILSEWAEVPRAQVRSRRKKAKDNFRAAYLNGATKAA